MAGYIAFEPLVPKRHRGIWHTLSHLDHTLSRIGLALAVSFLAYVVGALSKTVYEAVGVGLRRGPTVAGNVIYGLLDKMGLRPKVRVARDKSPRATALAATSERAPILYGDAGDAALYEMAVGRIEALSTVLPRVLSSSDKRSPLTAVTRQVEFLGIGPATSGPPEVQRLVQALLPIRPVIERMKQSLYETELPEPDEPLSESDRQLYDEGAREGVSAGVGARALANQVSHELRLARISLVGEQPELFSEIDRLQSEAEFRVAIAFPLVGLTAAMAWRATWWSALLLFIVATILFWSGRAQERRATDSLLEALRLGRAKVPSLDRFDEAFRSVKDLPSRA